MSIPIQDMQKSQAKAGKQCSDVGQEGLVMNMSQAEEQCSGMGVASLVKMTQNLFMGSKAEDLHKSQEEGLVHVTAWTGFVVKTLKGLLSSKVFNSKKGRAAKVLNFCSGLNTPGDSPS